MPQPEVQIPNESTSAAMSPKQGDRTALAPLNIEEAEPADSGDDTPLSELTMGLGKRDRTTRSPIRGDRNEDTARPSRRMV